MLAIVVPFLAGQTEVEVGDEELELDDAVVVVTVPDTIELVVLFVTGELDVGNPDDADELPVGPDVGVELLLNGLIDEDVLLVEEDVVVAVPERRLEMLLIVDGLMRLLLVVTVTVVIVTPLTVMVSFTVAVRYPMTSSTLVVSGAVEVS